MIQKSGEPAEVGTLPCHLQGFSTMQTMVVWDFLTINRIYQSHGSYMRQRMLRFVSSAPDSPTSLRNKKTSTPVNVYDFDVKITRQNLGPLRKGLTFLVSYI